MILEMLGSPVVRMASFRNLRVLLVGQKHAPLQSEISHDLSVVRVKFGDYVGLEILERANLREIAGVYKQQAGRGADGNRPQQQQYKRNAPDKLATT